MNLKELHDQIIKHEGLRLTPYRCSAGKLTIGIGRNLTDKGVTGEEARYLMENDLGECFKDLAVIFPNHFVLMPDLLKRVLIDMRFQLGPAGFRNFKLMIRAVQRDDLKGMIMEMKDSLWYRQTTARAEDLIGMVEMFLTHRDNPPTTASS